jgi:hypothetical protein
MDQQAPKLYEIAPKAARSAVAVIDAMSQRGAVKGEEMYTIGQLREQLMQVIQLSEIEQSNADG